MNNLSFNNLKEKEIIELEKFTNIVKKRKKY
jgi:hypothetical protein